MKDSVQSTSDKGHQKTKEPARPFGDPAAALFAPAPIHDKQFTSVNHSPGAVLALQRTIGNSAVRQLVHEQRRENHQSHATASHAFSSGVLKPTTAPEQNRNTVQRNEIQEMAQAARQAVRAQALERIQGNAMFGLLPALEGLPADIRTDEALGASVGGPRLVTAMKVVKAKGSDWMTFVAGNNGDLASLPNDQIGDIMHYLGAPKDARYFKSDMFDGRFDGAVDPAKGEVTLFFRVKFVVNGAQFGAALPGTKEWYKETEEGKNQFAADFKREVEQAWSKGTIKPACPIGSVKQLKAKVVVTTVDSGEHKTIYIHSDSSDPNARSNMGDDLGNLKVSDNKPKKHKTRYCDPKVDPKCTNPNLAKEVETTQITSVHEFGHAIGLHHPHCNDNRDICYGTNQEELESMMGKGDKQKTVKVKAGKQVRIHDDFQPFERIAEAWGKDVFPGALAKCNKWSGG